MDKPTYGQLLSTYESYKEGDRKLQTAKKNIERLLFSDERDLELQKLRLEIQSLDLRLNQLDVKLTKILKWTKDQDEREERESGRLHDRAERAPGDPDSGSDW